MSIVLGVLFGIAFNIAIILILRMIGRNRKRMSHSEYSETQLRCCDLFFEIKPSNYFTSVKIGTRDLFLL